MKRFKVELTIALNKIHTTNNRIKDNSTMRDYDKFVAVLSVVITCAVFGLASLIALFVVVFLHLFS